MTTNGLFGVFCFIFSAIWGVFLAKTKYLVAKMLCFYEEIEAIYTQTHKPSNHRYKLFVSQVQTPCTKGTNRLYQEYKPFVLLVRDYRNNRKGLS